MQPIQRLGSHPRWSDVVIHRGVATWVEVAQNPELNARGQIEQVLAQIDETLTSLGCDRTRVLSITVYLANLADSSTLNALWDQWVPLGHAPVRACVGVALSGTLAVEMIVTAAVD